MCIDTDLFGEVIITVSEVDTWLDVTANMQGRSQSQREHYAKTFDVANKIKLSKLNGSYYQLIDRIKIDAEYDAKPLSLFQTIYKTDENLDVKKPACPSWFHVCDNIKCPTYLKRIAHEKSSKRYAKEKAVNRF